MLNEAIPASDGWQRIATVKNKNGNGTINFRDTGLQPQTTYWYRVHAYNDIGAGAYSEYLCASTK